MANNQILIVLDLQPPEVAKLLKTNKTLRNSVFTPRNSAVKKSINSNLTLEIVMLVFFEAALQQFELELIIPAPTRIETAQSKNPIAYPTRPANANFTLIKSAKTAAWPIFPK
jgi:hypothetical protein